MVLFAVSKCSNASLPHSAAPSTLFKKALRDTRLAPAGGPVALGALPGALQPPLALPSLALNPPPLLALFNVEGDGVG